jgi:hypothetical protein
MSALFGELSDLLVESRQADDAVLALAKLEKGRELNDRDRAALADARDFLRDVRNGSAWLTGPESKIDSASTRFFSSFVRAADSMGSVGSAASLDSFTHQIEALLRSADALVEGQGAPEEGIKHLRKFFNAVLTRSLDEVDSMFSTAQFPRVRVA